MKDGTDFLVAGKPLDDIDRDAKRRALKDVYRWATEQADHLRMGRLALLDLDLLADEIEDVARSEFRSLASNLEIILVHMLKWDHQPGRRTRSWALSIDEHRLRVLNDLDDSPSLKSRADDASERAYRLARRKAAREAHLALSDLPETCPYDWSAIMNRPFVLDI